MRNEANLLNGIDISKWQQGINILGVNADFVVCQACYGANPEPTFHEQIESTLDCGKKAGAYIFITGQNGEISEFCSLVKPYVGRAILALDWEADNNAQWGNLEYLRNCIRGVQDATGVNPLVYFPASAYSQIYPLLQRMNCGAWVAQYANMNPTGYQESPWNEGLYNMAMFQYSSTGHPGGYNGSLDLDLFYGDRNAWDAYAKSDKPAALQSNAWSGEEIMALSNAIEGNRSYYVRTADGTYLSKEGDAPRLSPTPYIWYVQQNSDKSFSFADAGGDWITWLSGDASIAIGNGSLSQRFVIDGGQISPLEDKTAALFGSGFSFYPADRAMQAETLPTGALYAIKFNRGSWYLGEDGIMISQPYYWSVLEHADKTLSFEDHRAQWLTVKSLPATSADPLEDQIGNGRPTQNWILHEGQLSPATAPYLNIDCPANAPDEGKRMWVYSSNGSTAQQWLMVEEGREESPEAKPAANHSTDHRAYLQSPQKSDEPIKKEKVKPMESDTEKKPENAAAKPANTKSEEVIGDVADVIEKDVNDGSLEGDAKDIADKMSGMIEEALGKKALARKTVRWVFAIAIVIALACIVLSALSLSHCLPAWVAGLCAMIMGGTGIGGHALGISATTK